MDSLGEKVSYIKGLAQGLGLEEEDSKEAKILISIIDILQDIADAIEELETSQAETDDYIETLDEDIAELQSHVYGDYDEDDDDDVPDYIEVVCPHCNQTVYFDEQMFEEEDDLTCPNCNEPIYTECCMDHEDDEDDE
ncbi:MAG: hypothetical protein GX094_00925 [Clostridiales bacterium]|jgi:uncharacterized CHY-type Zn-finger protein|nr:hypothetical protein [Clostridiales bacterium]